MSMNRSDPSPRGRVDSRLPSLTNLKREVSELVPKRARRASESPRPEKASRRAASQQESKKPGISTRKAASTRVELKKGESDLERGVSHLVAAVEGLAKLAPDEDVIRCVLDTLTTPRVELLASVIELSQFKEFLRLMQRRFPPLILLRSVKAVFDVKSEASSSHGTRFTDPGGAGDPVEPVQFFAEGPPLTKENDLPVQVAQWQSPQGRIWNDETVEDMVGTARSVAARSGGSHAVALYTLQAQESRVLWFSFPVRRWFSSWGAWGLSSTDAARRL
eukprot:Hpha_TRINITY_DN15443_c1_g1::TRINITY_DN15443_c1_g1_i2::g.173967::m.173967